MARPHDLRCMIREPAWNPGFACEVSWAKLNVWWSWKTKTAVVPQLDALVLDPTSEPRMSKPVPNDEHKSKTVHET
jgi:hypothetical protein